MSCKNCGHDIFDHHDRAVAACAPELDTTYSAHNGGRRPRAKRCSCPGFEASDAHR